MVLNLKMELSAHAWKSCAACAHDEDDMNVYCKRVGCFKRSRNLQNKYN